MATINRFEEMEIWKLARQLSLDIFETYSSSKDFVIDFKLKDQINGSSGSIMDNVAEGFERNGRNEFVNFLSYAKGSTGEVKSQLYRALDRKYISQEKFDKLYLQSDILARKIASFIKYLNRSDLKGTKFKERADTGNGRSNPQP
jgi:four helix bundle protein